MVAVSEWEWSVILVKENGGGTTGIGLFVVCPEHMAKPLKRTTKTLPCAARGKFPTASRDDDKDGFAVCLLSGTRKNLCRVFFLAHDKKKVGDDSRW